MPRKRTRRSRSRRTRRESRLSFCSLIESKVNVQPSQVCKEIPPASFLAKLRTLRFLILPLILLSYPSHHLDGALSVLAQSFSSWPIWSVNDILDYVYLDLTRIVVLVKGTFSEINISACACVLIVFFFITGNDSVRTESVQVSYRSILYSP